MKNYSQACRQVEDRLFQNLLGNHQHCIHQLVELRKTDDIARFPEICPYAYAYVFWRKSLFKKEHFYDESSLRKINIFEETSLIIEDHLDYFCEQIVSFQMKIQRCIDARILFWIIEKLVVQFSENFFNAWLEIAGRRSKEISTPSWNEVNTMRDRSFPNVALKYNFVEKTLSSFIEYHYLKNEEVSAYKYVCPYQHESAKRNIYTMESYTPQSVAIQVRRNTPDIFEKKALQKSVESYVKRLNF